MNETLRVELRNGLGVVVRIARHAVPWFADEGYISAQARRIGVPSPEVLGVEHMDYDGELLSFSIQRLLPGRTLDDLAGELPETDLERLVMDAGELLARVHRIVPDRGMRHEIQPPDESFVGRVARVIGQTFGPAAVTVVERAADFLREEVRTRPAPVLSLTHGDWVPKNFLIDGGSIVGVIDWEFAGSAAPAFDMARWEVSAGHPLHDRSDLLRHGYARITDPYSADGGWVPAFAIDWALEKLGWKNPASPAAQRRCLDVITRYLDA
jgi:aminoglycoside phosphotransferase (APT) family kinase protein